MLESLKTFWEKGDFDNLMDILGRVDLSEMITNPIVIGIIVVLVAMTFVQATLRPGQDDSFLRWPGGLPSDHHSYFEE